MSHEFIQEDASEISIWQSKRYTLESNQVDILINALQPGEAGRVFNSVRSDNLTDAGMLPQLMMLGTKSTIVMHPLIVARGRAEFDTGIESQRQRFIDEVKTLRTLLHDSGIAEMDYISKDVSKARLLALGVFTEQILHQVRDLDLPNDKTLFHS